MQTPYCMVHHNSHLYMLKQYESLLQLRTSESQPINQPALHTRTHCTHAHTRTHTHTLSLTGKISACQRLWIQGQIGKYSESGAGTPCSGSGGAPAGHGLENISSGVTAVIENSGRWFTFPTKLKVLVSIITMAHFKMFLWLQPHPLTPASSSHTQITHPLTLASSQTSGSGLSSSGVNRDGDVTPPLSSEVPEPRLSTEAPCSKHSSSGTSDRNPESTLPRLLVSPTPPPPPPPASVVSWSCSLDVPRQGKRG
jgi:hypothetical protein